MTPPPIPLIRAAGSHREVGRQIGSATAETVRRSTAAPFDADLVRRYRAVTVEHLPWVVEELDGVAEAAGVDPLAVFAASIEELAPVEAPTGCSDLVVTGELSANGHLLVAHNNDLYAEDEEDVVAIEWRVPGEPVVFTLGIGPWISVGWNDAGLSVTGNEVSPNDERVGIPRLLQVRDVLTRRTLAEADRREPASRPRVRVQLGARAPRTARPPTSRPRRRAPASTSPATTVSSPTRTTTHATTCGHSSGRATTRAPARASIGPACWRPGTALPWSASARPSRTTRTARTRSAATATSRSR